ncbi:MAG: hypothetical protein V4582_17165 [Pseudomonadota bacterium]
MSFDLGSILQHYLGGDASTDQQRIAEDFDQVVDKVPQESLAHGVSAALRSPQAPPFPQVVAQLFEQGSAEQRVGMLSQLVGTTSPSVLSLITGGTLGAPTAGNGAGTVVTPEQVAQLTSAQVAQIAAHAQERNAGVVDAMGAFYAQHPDLLKSIGGVALAYALGKIAEHMRR